MRLSSEKAKRKLEHNSQQRKSVLTQKAFATIGASPVFNQPQPQSQLQLELLRFTPSKESVPGCVKDRKLNINKESKKKGNLKVRKNTNNSGAKKDEKVLNAISTLREKRDKEDKKIKRKRVVKTKLPIVTSPTAEVIKAMSQAKNNQSRDTTEEEEAELATMDVRTVLKMFKEIKKELKELKQENASKEQAMSLERTQFDNKFKNISETTKRQKKYDKTLSGIVIRMHDEIGELRSKVEELEMDKCRNTMVLSGFVTDSNGRELREEMEVFFSQELTTEVDIVSFYKIGQQEPRPIVFSVDNSLQKRELMNNKSKLKEIENINGGLFYLNNYFPAAVNERRRREREIMKENYSKDVEDQLDMKATRSGLLVQNELYKKKVTPPKPDAVLNLSIEDLDRILAIPLKKGKMISEMNSVFQAYSAKVTTHQEIREVYQKIKLLHPASRHIICAFNLVGLPTYLNQDFCDDDDYSCGRVLLNLLVSNSIKSTAVFVVRQFGGSKLGNKRFTCMIEAAKSAIGEDRFVNQNNSTTKPQEQQMNKRQLQPLSHYLSSRGPRNIRGYRGGGRTQGKMSLSNRRGMYRRGGGLRPRQNRNIQPEMSDTQDVFQFQPPTNVFTDDDENWPAVADAWGVGNNALERRTNARMTTTASV